MPADHAVVAFLTKAHAIALAASAQGKRKQTPAERLIKEFRPLGFVSEVSRLKAELSALYPLFEIYSNWTMSSLCDEASASWAEYIILKDRARQAR